MYQNMEKNSIENLNNIGTENMIEGEYKPEMVAKRALLLREKMENSLDN